MEEGPSRQVWFSKAKKRAGRDNPCGSISWKTGTKVGKHNFYLNRSLLRGSCGKQAREVGVGQQLATERKYLGFMGFMEQ